MTRVIELPASAVRVHLDDPVILPWIFVGVVRDLGIPDLDVEPLIDPFTPPPDTPKAVTP